MHFLVLSLILLQLASENPQECSAHTGINFHCKYDIFLFWLDCSKSNLSKDQAQPSSSMNMPQSFGTAMGFSLSETLSMASLPGPSQNANQLHTSEDSIIYLAPTADTNKCWPIRPTLRNELDTFSVHFYVFFGPNISIPPDRAAVFAINLMPVLDSGGVLNMELKLNLVSCSNNSCLFWRNNLWCDV